MKAISGMRLKRVNILAAASTAVAFSLTAIPASTAATVTPCKGIAITPTSNVQAQVNAAPAGSVFCFASGTYRVSKLIPKAGDTFDGNGRKAILDGGNASQYAFYGDANKTGPGHVTIQNFTIRRYKTPMQSGAIQAFNGASWTIRNNDISHNAAVAVATGSGARVLSNTLNYNGEEGFAIHGENILYQANEIGFNNANLAVDASWEAGGGKAWETKNLTFKQNYVHDNGGPGLWSDTNNIYTTYDGNRVENNWGPGIYHEISYNAKIINNVVRNNGMPTSPGGGDKREWMFDAGIQLRQSQSLNAASPLLIANNVVINNYNAIALIDSPKDGCTNKSLNEGAYGPCKIQNVTVQNNYIAMSQGATGAVQDGSGPTIFTSHNNHFIGNRYCMPVANHPNDGYTDGWLAWSDSFVSWKQWQAAGNDKTGTFTVSANCAK